MQQATCLATREVPFKTFWHDNRFGRQGGATARGIARQVLDGIATTPGGLVATIQAVDGDRILGSILAFHDPAYHSHGRRGIGCFGLVDLRDDRDTLDTLLQAARDHLHDAGIATIRGPVNLPRFLFGYGCQAAGFDQPARSDKTMVATDQHPTGSTGRFPPNAGTCDKCGMGTTWKARFTNPVTGKHIPAHVNDDGTLLGGDGDCPYYKERRKPAGSTGGTVAMHVASATAPPAAAPPPPPPPAAATQVPAPAPPATATTAPAGATFPNDASTCSRCGGPLTWRQRVLNPATGKMMPAHLTPEGTLLGDGHCPAFAACSPSSTGGSCASRTRRGTSGCGG